MGHLVHLRDLRQVLAMPAGHLHLDDGDHHDHHGDLDLQHDHDVLHDHHVLHVHGDVHEHNQLHDDDVDHLLEDEDGHQHDLDDDPGALRQTQRDLPHHRLPGQHHLREHLRSEDDQPPLRPRQRLAVRVPLREPEPGGGASLPGRRLRPQVPDLRHGGDGAGGHGSRAGLHLGEAQVRPQRERRHHRGDGHRGLRDLRGRRVQQEDWRCRRLCA
mmetsp:Transcript_21856/g.65216  ORF Transcript_21856/g.65216 Transcript_21856/m.65216 type:complete len:215 (+) Transcript_21856:1043-1687(+)